MYLAIRALIDPDGLRNSSLTHIPSTMTSGVLPIASRIVPPPFGSRPAASSQQHAHKLRREQLAEPLRHRQECAQTAAEADVGTRPRVIRTTGTASAAVLADGVRRPRAAGSVGVRRPPVWGQVCSLNRSRCAHACGIDSRWAGQPAFTIPQRSQIHRFKPARPSPFFDRV